MRMSSIDPSAEDKSQNRRSGVGTQGGAVSLAQGLLMNRHPSILSGCKAEVLKSGPGLRVCVVILDESLSSFFS